MSQHVMIDLETWGTGNYAVPVSIGAVKFDPAKSESEWSTFHIAVDPESAMKAGLRADAETILWWMDDTRREALHCWYRLERVDLTSALDGFATWFGAESLPVWGNGATFDNVILRNAFIAAGQDCPWKFWHDRCFRTMKALPGARELEPRRAGTHHDALDDALHQARHLIRIVEHFNLTL